MSIWTRLRNALEDPPPAFAFELSQAGIAYARNANGSGAAQIGFQPLESDVLSVSPLHDNILRPEALAGHIRTISGAGDAKKRRHAALILPDYCSRVAVLDFDAFPTDPEEQLSLVRFRVKKSVPFDIESAAVSYYQQPHSGSGKKMDVVVAVVALEIMARYEAVLRAANFQPGFVTTSSLATLDLLHLKHSAEPTVEVVAKLAGRVLSVSVLQGNLLKLFRCVELPEVTTSEIMTILFPTFAYVEDELKAKPSRMLLCGFGRLAMEAGPEWEAELNVPVEPMRSRLAAPEQTNAGLLGYLENLAN